MATEKKKHLHELLEDDQEPFHLNHYIADIRSQRKCPMFDDLRSPTKNKTRNGGVFLHIPARTAAILLEAAARIQSEKANNRARNRGNAFGMLGSVLKGLTNRKAKPRLGNADGNAVLSETTGSRGRECLVEIGDECFCESPFHYVLHASPSTSGHQTPYSTSTATSPTLRITEEEDSDETESLEKVRGQEEVDKEEEDKEQCSPVSVLDPLEKEKDHHQQREPDHLNLLSSSSEVVQQAKRRRLLKKLRRFEKLSGMDPIDLEGKMISEEQEEEYEESVEDDNMRVYGTDEEYEDVDEAMARESVWAEEERRKKNNERHKKWRMMNAWRVGVGAEEAAEAVVEKDLRGEAGEWTRYGEEVEEVVSDIELSIFIFLIDEFSHELVCMNR